jgi:hypothetical protein
VINLYNKFDLSRFLTVNKRFLLTISAFLLVVISVLPLSSCTCTSVGGKVYKDCHGDLIPCADGTYDLGSETRRWHEFHFDDVWVALHPELDHTHIANNGVPTDVLINTGASATSRGFSLPIWYSPDNANEELYYSFCVPQQWNGETDLEVRVYCVLAGAESDKDFKINLNWEHWTIGDAVPSTSNLVSEEQNTGIGALVYTSYVLTFTINYDIDILDEIQPDDMVTFRIRRDYSSAQKDTLKEIIISNVEVMYQANKLGELVTP